MKTLSDLLSSSPLQAYQVKHRQMTKLATVFTALVSEEWRKNCQVANFENGQLTLVVNNSGWATKVHYATPELISNLKLDDYFATLRTIKTKIMALPLDEPEPSLKRLPLLAKQLLECTANQVTDPKLKTSLLKLASRYRDEVTHPQKRENQEQEMK
jgi:hypothetical protein